jgi:hypothetical protein
VKRASILKPLTNATQPPFSDPYAEFEPQLHVRRTVNRNREVINDLARKNPQLPGASQEPYCGQSASQPDGAELPQEVLDFAIDQNIVEYVKQAVQATREVFADADRVTVTLKQDEYGDRYVDINAVVRDEPEAEAEKYSACVERWATLIPPGVGGKVQLSTSWA